MHTNNGAIAAYRCRDGFVILNQLDATGVWSISEKTSNNMVINCHLDGVWRPRAANIRCGGKLWTCCIVCNRKVFTVLHVISYACLYLFWGFEHSWHIQGFERPWHVRGF